MPTQQQLTQQINERERRLHQLKLQQARQGFNVDPAITLEIEDIERELTGLRRLLATAPADPVDAPPTVTDAAGREASHPQPI
ncbi:MAG: hypothetical protein KDI02_27165, partial [Anaerolineae bacterium]|nr:hypothetical protein [Anaerolineae bacterium]